MKVVLCLRTKNEEKNIGKICSLYRWVDSILIADGGSTDDTVSLASKFANVKVREYEGRLQMENGIVRNPHGEHLNFLIDWAFQDEGADWIIHDDADCFPNRFVQDNAMQFFKSTEKKFIYVTRLYLWKDEGHFPKMAMPHGTSYVPSLWAWHRSSGLRFRENTDPKSHQELSFIPQESVILKLMPPYALLHCPWPDDETVEKKLKFYRESGEVPNMVHPLHVNGQVEPLPEWAWL